MRVAAGVCIRRVEEAVLKDLGGRGVAALACPGDMEPAARALHSSTCVGISTGFPCLPDPPHHETDGPPGAMALAHALTVLGKEVLMLTDRTTTPVMAGLLRPRPDAVVSPAATVVPFPFVPSSSEAEAEAQRLMLSRIDHMVAIERSGRAADGCHYSMTGRDISALVEPIDDVFLASCAPTGCGTTAIGDGGNEVGMGKVRSLAWHKTRPALLSMVLLLELLLVLVLGLGRGLHVWTQPYLMSPQLCDVDSWCCSLEPASWPGKAPLAN
jgi:hypothetical protein